MFSRRFVGVFLEVWVCSGLKEEDTKDRARSARELKWEVNVFKWYRGERTGASRETLGHLCQETEKEGGLSRKSLRLWGRAGMVSARPKDSPSATAVMKGAPHGELTAQATAPPPCWVLTGLPGEGGLVQMLQPQLETASQLHSPQQFSGSAGTRRGCLHF